MFKCSLVFYLIDIYFNFLQKHMKKNRGLGIGPNPHYTVKFK